MLLTLFQKHEKKNGKLPNMDFLTQEVGKFLKLSHNNQDFFEMHVNNLLDFTKL